MCSGGSRRHLLPDVPATVARAGHWKQLLDRRVCKSCRNRYIMRRELGYIIDSLVYTLVAFAVVLPLATLASVTSLAGPNGPAAVPPAGVLETGIELVTWILAPLLFCFRDAWAGRPPGKALCGLRVVDAFSREPISPGRSLKRNLPLMIPYVGLLVCLITLHLGRRWSDRWAGATVVWEKFAHRPPFAPDGRLCFFCGYDLTGNVTGVCPECGQPVDRHDQAAPVA